jgi:hypothetical protein
MDEMTNLGQSIHDDPYGVVPYLRGTHLGHSGSREGGDLGWRWCPLFSAWWPMVRAAYDSPPVVVAGKTASTASDGGP